VTDRDEYGIPTGNHTLPCGCKAKGRKIVEPCAEHRHILRADAEIMSLPTPGRRPTPRLRVVEQPRGRSRRPARRPARR
jgi:hypothetical protein